MLYLLNPSYETHQSRFGCESDLEKGDKFIHIVQNFMNKSHLQWIEDAALCMTQMGMPLATGKIFSFLLVCEPEYRSMPELIEELKISKGGASTGLRLLIQFGFVEKFRLPSKKIDLYHIRPDAWLHHYEEIQKKILAIQMIAEKGLQLFKGSGTKMCRIHDMHRFCAWSGKRLPGEIAEYKKYAQLMD